MTRVTVGGDLGEYLQNYVQERGDGAYLPEERVLRWVLNAACGLRDIHNANVIHRNIGVRLAFFEVHLVYVRVSVHTNYL